MTKIYIYDIWMGLKIGYTPGHLPKENHQEHDEPVDLGGAQFPGPVLRAGT